jgi:hypothetical protein
MNRLKYEILSAKMAKKALAGYTKNLSERLALVSTYNDIEAVIKEPIQDTGIRSLYNEIYKFVGVDFAKNTYESIIKRANKNMDLFWLQQMQYYVDSSLGDRIAMVTRTTYENIQENARKGIEKGIKDGLGAKDTARLIVKEQGKIDTWRALRIARTEVVGASNIASFKGAQATGLKLNKVWLSATDSRVRTDPYNHRLMSGKEVPMNEKFVISSSDGSPDVMLMVPADPNATGDNVAGNVINCRCSVTYNVL